MAKYDVFKLEGLEIPVGNLSQESQPNQYETLFGIEQELVGRYLDIFKVRDPEFRAKVLGSASDGQKQRMISDLMGMTGVEAVSLDHLEGVPIPNPAKFETKARRRDALKAQKAAKKGRIEDTRVILTHADIIAYRAMDRVLAACLDNPDYKGSIISSDIVTIPDGKGGKLPITRAIMRQWDEASRNSIELVWKPFIIFNKDGTESTIWLLDASQTDFAYQPSAEAALEDAIQVNGVHNDNGISGTETSAHDLAVDDEDSKERALSLSSALKDIGRQAVLNRAPDIGAISLDGLLGYGQQTLSAIKELVKPTDLGTEEMDPELTGLTKAISETKRSIVRGNAATLAAVMGISVIEGVEGFVQGFPAWATEHINELLVNAPANIREFLVGLTHENILTFTIIIASVFGINRISHWVSGRIRHRNAKQSWLPRASSYINGYDLFVEAARRERA